MKTIQIMTAITTCTALITCTMPEMAQAASFTLNAIDQGWWSDGATSFSNNNNYIVGNNVVTNRGTNSYRNYFIFDLSTLPAGEVVTSAILQLDRANSFGDPLQTYGLFDVSTPIATLRNKVNNPNSSIYNDLGTGTSYGSFVVNRNDPASPIDFVLNGAGVAAINGNAGGVFTLGGSLLNSSPGQQYLFGLSQGSVQRLYLETKAATAVPTPALLPGLIGMGVAAWRKRKSLASRLATEA